jgi:hypothetical protein
MVTDPYKLLPKMFEDVSDKDFILLNNDQLRDGGAAMTAYAMLQFTEMSDYERNEIRKALLKYCELDHLQWLWFMRGGRVWLSKKENDILRTMGEVKS